LFANIAIALDKDWNELVDKILHKLERVVGGVFDFIRSDLDIVVANVSRSTTGDNGESNEKILELFDTLNKEYKEVMDSML